MKILIALIVLTFGFSTAIHVECEFKFTKNEKHPEFRRYQCYVKWANIEDNIQNITNLYGGQPLGHTDNDVTMFHSDKNILKKIPRNIRGYFDNIEMVDIYQAEIEEITVDELRQFGRKLKILLLIGNKIRTLQSSLFTSTPNLEWINLSENRIDHVEFGTFSVLPKLNRLVFEINVCHSEKANDRAKVNQLIEEINKNCGTKEFLIRQYESRVTEHTRGVMENAELKANATALQNIINEKTAEIKNLRFYNTDYAKNATKVISQLKEEIAKMRDLCDNDDILASVDASYNKMKSEVNEACTISRS